MSNPKKKKLSKNITKFISSKVIYMFLWFLLIPSLIIVKLLW